MVWIRFKLFELYRNQCWCLPTCNPQTKSRVQLRCNSPKKWPKLITSFNIYVWLLIYDEYMIGFTDTKQTCKYFAWVKNTMTKRMPHQWIISPCNYLMHINTLCFTFQLDIITISWAFWEKFRYEVFINKTLTMIYMYLSLNLWNNNHLPLCKSTYDV